MDEGESQKKGYVEEFMYAQERSTEKFSDSNLRHSAQ